MRKNLYIILAAVTVAMAAAILLFSKDPGKQTPPFKNRAGAIALAGEWLNSKKAMEGLLANIERNPDDNKSRLALAQAYIQEGRETGDHGYYDKAAIELLDQVLEKEPNNFEALCCKATVLLSQHHFAEGLALAQKALPLNPNSAFIYGILCDANLELGQYHNAVIMADKMISLRPDIRSYSRASYLREIHGDVNGAIQAMKLAVSAGYPGLEQTEWARCVLAHLYETKGSVDSAATQYMTALAERPGYAFALAGMGRVEKANGHYKAAIANFEKAKNTIVEYSFSDELTDLYELNNEKEKSDQNAKEVIAMLGNKDGAEGESGHGHYADKELAYAYLKVNDLDNAMKHAQLEFERRPNNIDVAETMAWVSYKKGQFSEANTYIDTALKTNIKNPQLLCRAGLIKIKAGEIAKGKDLIRTAMQAQPFIEPGLAKEAQLYL